MLYKVVIYIKETKHTYNDIKRINFRYFVGCTRKMFSFPLWYHWLQILAVCWLF